MTSNIVKTAAAEVMSELGPGLSEVIYQRALCEELRKHGSVSSEVVIPIVYNTITVGFIRADIIFDENLVLELKAKSTLTSGDRVQAATYTKNGRNCMLINFSISGDVVVEEINSVN